MAQTFTFYSGFAKRSNSTKRPPSGTFSITYDSVLFKDNTSFRNPVIQLNVSLDNNMYVYKYCYHADSGRYYFINDWRWVKGIWECSLTCDLLATFKPDISSYLGILVRATPSDTSPIFIPDSFTQSLVATQVVNITPSDTYIGTNNYILGIKGNVGIDYYAFDSYSEVSSVLSKFYGSMSELFPDVDYNTFDPDKYIYCLNIVPYTVSGTAYSQIFIGPWGVDANCRKIDSTYKYDSISVFTAQAHPQSGTVNRKVYLDTAPYSKIYGSLPGFGTFSFEPISNQSEEDITYTIEVHADPRTCDAYCLITNGKRTPYLKLLGNLGGSLLISGAQPTYPIRDIAADWAMSFVSNIATKKSRGERNYILGGKSPYDSDPITNIENRIMPGIEWAAVNLPILGFNVTSVGTQKTPVLYDPLNVYEVFQLVETADYNIVGAPCYKTSVPVSGFNQYISASFSSAKAYANEISLINEYLESGFYYE